MARIDVISRAEVHCGCVAEQMDDGIAVNADGEIRFSIAHDRLDRSQRYKVRAQVRRAIGATTGGSCEADPVRPR